VYPTAPYCSSHCRYPAHVLAQFLFIVSMWTRSSAIAVIADRTACSILTPFIVIATSRPLNKEIRSLSVRGSNNYCGSASAIHSPHTSAAPAVALFTTPSRHAMCHCWQTTRAFSTHMRTLAWIHRHLWRFSLRFFVVHFVAKRYILQKKCLKGQIGTCLLGTRWCNF